MRILIEYLSTVAIGAGVAAGLYVVCGWIGRLVGADESIKHFSGFIVVLVGGPWIAGVAIWLLLAGNAVLMAVSWMIPT